MRPIASGRELARPTLIRLCLVTVLGLAGLALAVPSLLSPHADHRLAASWPTRSVPTVYSHGDGMELAAATVGSAQYTGAAPRRVRCVRDRFAPAFQVVYAYPRDSGSHRSSALATIRQAMEQANGVVFKSARETSPRSDVRLRVRCDRYRRIAVSTYAFSKAGADGHAETFHQLVTAGRRTGFRSEATKYVVFWDSPVPGMCGQAEMHVDERRTVDNANNVGDDYAVLYGRGCWDGANALHEIGHTMGAVQNDAPHSTGTSHCYQEQDIMCYADGGPAGRTANLEVSCSQVVRFDCGHDDYFRVGRARGYLATHWQAGWARNRFLSFRGVP